MTEYTYTDSFAPDSTLVNAAYYNRTEKRLFVKLNGSIYGYNGFSSDSWDEFLYSPSAGNHFNAHIRGKHTPLDVKGITLRYIGVKEAAFQDSAHTFIITGHSVVSWEFQGRTLEDAKSEFARLFPEGTLQKVEVKFE